MTWFRQIAGIVVTTAALIVAGSISFGKVTARIDEQCVQIRAKADREPIQRELDQMQERLLRIEDKLDAVLSQ